MAPNIIQRTIQRMTGYRFNTQSGVGIYEMMNPPDWDYKKYLSAYGQIGWLYAVVSVRANNIARNPWRLYRVDSQGDRTELNENDAKAGDLIRLISRPNKFQTRYNFFYQHQNYKDLVGEAFWQINFNNKGLPAEMWLAPPAYMNVIPDNSPNGNYIAGYEFKKNVTRILFTPEEIIHIMHPNPANPFRGISPAQALTTNLAVDQLSRKHQEKVFYNNAIPALVVSYKADAMPKTSEQRKELEQSFDERFRGVRNAGKTMFAYGSDVHAIALDNHQLDIIELNKMSRDDILGAYNTHPSIVGISENVNRANADAANYQFALQVVTPELTDIREALNQKLCPFFGDYLNFDYDNPVSEDVAQQATILDGHVKSGIISIEEAREELGNGEIALDDHFVLAPGWQVVTGADLLAGVSNTQSSIPPNDQPKSLKKKYSDAEGEEIWKRLIKPTEAYEPPLIKVCNDIFSVTKEDVLRQVNEGKKPHVNETQIRTGYKDKATPILTKCLQDSIKNGADLVTPKNLHKVSAPPKPTTPSGIPPVVSGGALEWLKTRIVWAGEQISDTLANDLASALTEGYANGESISQITDRVNEFFNDPVRAERISRTEVITASNQGALYGYEDAGCDECEFYCALDERVCEVCFDLHGQIFKLEDATNIITGSTHPSCRCCFLPVIK